MVVEKMDDETAEERVAREKEYKKSLWPPGTDISLYNFDPQLYWCAAIRRLITNTLILLTSARV